MKNLTTSVLSVMLAAFSFAVVLDNQKEIEDRLIVESPSPGILAQLETIWLDEKPNGMTIRIFSSDADLRNETVRNEAVCAVLVQPRTKGRFGVEPNWKDERTLEIRYDSIKKVYWRNHTVKINGDIFELRLRETK